MHLRVASSRMLREEDCYRKAPMDTYTVTPDKGGSLMQRTLIMLVEDEAAIRKMTALVLRRLGYLVQEASSGEEALRWAQANREKIDLLMTDVFMSGMSGHELAGALQYRNPDLKVLFLSGHTLQTEAAFLQKPFTVEAVSKKIREVLDRR
jgi:two-component system, cell cycle sensor histidine kinase and response regulator CckA